VVAQVATSKKVTKPPASIQLYAKKAVDYLAVALLVFQLGMPVALYANIDTCLSATGEAAVKACKNEIGISPDNINVRFAMCDALISLNRYEDAVVVLEDGLKRLPGNTALERKLALARSYVSERTFITRQNPDTKTNALARRNTIRCNALKGAAALDACSAALKDNPADPELYKAKGNALLTMDRYVESILAYRKTLQLSPGNKEAATKLKTAEAKRQTLVTKCGKQKGAGALATCEAALLRGAPDQLKIQRKKGDLLLSMNRTQEAIRAYREALAIDPGNKALTKKISALTEPRKVVQVADASGVAAEKTKQEKTKQTDKSREQPAPEPAPEPAPKQKPKEVQSEKPEETVIAKRTDLSTAGESADARLIASKDSTASLAIKKRYSNAPLANGATY
jgi:tetratricopeptide (TPR) repeat protein